jgi:hypothetical protein
MKKLIVMDPVRICGSDLTSGTLDEKRKCMGYDSIPPLGPIPRRLKNCRSGPRESMEKNDGSSAEFGLPQIYQRQSVADDSYPPLINTH